MARRVSIIDDDQDVLDLFTELLSEYGFEVATYTEALPGIEQLTASRPDLIIVDLRLDPQREELTGGQIIHSVRSGSALRHVPIIVCTAATDVLREAWPDLMQRGDIHQLAKPFDLATFERVVETALGQQHPDLGSGFAGDQIDEIPGAAR